MQGENKTKSKDGKQFKHYRLKPETVADLDTVAKLWGCSPSAVVERLVEALTQFGADRVAPAGVAVAGVTLESAVGLGLG